MTMISDANKAKARALCAKLTLEEKIGMVHGAGLFRTQSVERLGIPPLRFDDGPMGVREEMADDSWTPVYRTRDEVTYLPSGSAVASTWNTALAHLCGQVLGQEARGRGKDMILGPSVNIKRSPLCGRNFEYLSEDPYLTAEIAVPFIDGVQESDVSACAKHYAVNNQETDRLDVDETVSERALREIYLPAFGAAVERAGVMGIMGAYNKVNGVQCCESKHLLDEILRDEWNFDGIVVSDWSAIKDTQASATRDIDIDMRVETNFDEYPFAQPLLEAVRQGVVDERHVDRKVEHILAVMDALHMLGDDTCQRKSGCYATIEHDRDALAIARESIVLLKNDRQVLPLDERAVRRLLVVGANADLIHSTGGGSAVIKALHEITPLLGLNGMLGGNVQIEYLPGYKAAQVTQVSDWQAGSLSNAELTEEELEDAKRLREEAVEKAAQYAAQGDPVVFIGGLDHDHDLEGRDRDDMDLPYGQNELIEALLEAAPDTIVTLVAGSPVAMPWEVRAHTIVWNWYNGAQSGTALAEILFGRVAPSGHLPETFPLTIADCPANSVGTFGKRGHVEYSEDIYVGYRYYETAGKPVRFCFGHGLTYTTFEYRDLCVGRFGDTIRCAFLVANTGTRSGYAVPQLYMGLEQTGEDRPTKELKGFAKVLLEPGECRQITIDVIATDALRYWSKADDTFRMAPAAALYVGESVQDIRLTGSVAFPQKCIPSTKDNK